MPLPSTEPPRVTLDRNCLIDVEENRQPHVEAVLQLRKLSEAGAVLLSAPASAASELQHPDKEPITNFAQFVRWVHGLGFKDIEFLAPICYFGLSFWGHCLLGGGPAQALEERVHSVIAPEVPYQSPPDQVSRRWRNRKCDVQAVWCHVYYGTDVLCTRDDALIRRSRRLGIPAARVCTPADLFAELRSS